MDISNILPSEVKSIKYVDGVGAAVYGSNGANGVIVITLKR
jgi:outer membrane cobalamin receptor